MMFKAKNNKTPTCPLLKGECIKDGCMFWTHVQGQSPQDGKQIDHYDCAVKWLPVLMIENSQQQRQTGAAVESLRNENVTTGQQITGALMQVAASSKHQLTKADS